MPRADPTSQSRNPQLADALQTRDMAAVAFALRHGPTVVPVADASVPAEPWTFRDPATGRVSLLLFSDAAHRPGGLPEATVLWSLAALRHHLADHGADLVSVFLDVAGPHPMQASPGDLLAALEAPGAGR